MDADILAGAAHVRISLQGHLHFRRRIVYFSELGNFDLFILKFISTHIRLYNAFFYSSRFSIVVQNGLKKCL